MFLRKFDWIKFDKLSECVCPWMDTNGRNLMLQIIVNIRKTVRLLMLLLCCYCYLITLVSDNLIVSCTAILHQWWELSESVITSANKNQMIPTAARLYLLVGVNFQPVWKEHTTEVIISIRILITLFFHNNSLGQTGNRIGFECRW